MTSVRDIDGFMSEWAKKELSEEWDNDGVMLCGDLDKKVEKILVCLEINEKTAKEAADKDCDLIVTHHPFIFRPLKKLCGTEFSLVFSLIAKGISVLSYHTRLDAAAGGVNDALAQKIGLSEVSEFAHLGRVGKLDFETDAMGFCDHIKEKLGCSCLKISNAACDKKIKRVAVLGGAGKDFVADAANVADAYVTGDLSHNAFITANETGILAVDAGHYHTENPVVKVIAKRLSEAFPELNIQTADSLCPYTQI